MKPEEVINARDLFSIHGKVALITGGSRGIGLMIARGYLESGAKVYISSRKREVCDETARKLSEIGDCISIPADVSTASGCKQLAVAPCCYNRIHASAYQPLSEAGRASTLQLSVDDLGLPLSETVTAGKRVRLQRERCTGVTLPGQKRSNRTKRPTLLSARDRDPSFEVLFR